MVTINCTIKIELISYFQITVLIRVAFCDICAPTESCWTPRKCNSECFVADSLLCLIHQMPFMETY